MHLFSSSTSLPYFYHPAASARAPFVVMQPQSGRPLAHQHLYNRHCSSFFSFFLFLHFNRSSSGHDPTTSFWFTLFLLLIVIGFVSSSSRSGPDHQRQLEVNLPHAQRLIQSRKTLPLPTPSLLEYDPELSPDQVQLLGGIIKIGFNASDYLLNVLEPRLYHEGRH